MATALTVSRADDTKANLAYQLVKTKVDDEAALTASLEQQKEQYRVNTNTQVAEFKTKIEREHAKIKANEERTLTDIKEKKRFQEERILTKQLELVKRLDAQESAKLKRLDEVLKARAKEFKDDFGSLKKELAEYRKSFHQEQQKNLDIRRADRIESEKMQEELMRLEIQYMENQFKGLLEATSAKLNKDYELEKMVNGKQDEYFRKDFEENRKLGSRRIGHLGLLLNEQKLKIESDKMIEMKAEIMRLSELKISLQKATDYCIATCFIDGRSAKIGRKMRESMESLRDQLYGLAAHMIGVERKMAELEEVGGLREQITKVKQNNNKATAKITDYLRYFKLSKIVILDRHYRDVEFGKEEVEPA
uniref:DUF4200 domain-containing protein n=1 Tax=Caenorhabditis tropicalis TaxID=1561998 RepID=A0A1I7UGE3_9PELO